MQIWIFLAGLLTSMAICFLAIPSIITVAKSKGLYGVAREEDKKFTNVPTLGGLAVYAGIMIPMSIYAGLANLAEFPFLVTSLVLLFFIGIKDDILIIAPRWKLLGQLLAALAITLPGGIRIVDPGRFLNLAIHGEAAEIIVSVLAIVVIINSYNLIDGIDGLGSGLGLLAAIVFGIVFYQAGLQAWAFIASIITGSLTGFVWYNVFSNKKKIYMGDTGSLVIGFMLSLMVLHILNLDTVSFIGQPIQTPLAFVLAVLIVPVYDLIRVVVLRIRLGRSPLKPDRRHIHYKMIDRGLTHLQATGILLGVTLSMVLLTLLLQQLGEILLIAILAASASLNTYLASHK